MIESFNCEQMAYPAGPVFCLAAAVICVGFAVYVVCRLLRERKLGLESKRPFLQVLWAVAFALSAIILIFVSYSSISIDNRLKEAYRTGNYTSFTGILTDIEVEDKGVDFLENPVYRITLTVDDKYQFTCTWLTTDQILLLQKGVALTVGCAEHVGFVTAEDNLTIYQAPDQNGNVVCLEVEVPEEEKE